MNSVGAALISPRGLFGWMSEVRGHQPSVGGRTVVVDRIVQESHKSERQEPDTGTLFSLFYFILFYFSIAVDTQHYFLLVSGVQNSVQTTIQLTVIPSPPQ